MPQSLYDIQFYMEPPIDRWSSIIDKAIDKINDLLVDAQIDQPAGPNTGYSIIFDENSMREILLKFVNYCNEKSF